MKKMPVLGLACIAGLLVASPAKAVTYDFSFFGNGITSTGQFTATLVPGTDYYQITGVNGAFSDANDGVSGAITGLVGPAATDDSVHTFTNTTSMTSPGLSYDNLFWPAGDSPHNCADYPFYGGDFDVYGLTFTLSDGEIGGVWSDGVIPGPGQVYGAGDASPAGVLLDDPGMGTGEVVKLSVSPAPEPGSIALLATGLTGIAAAARTRRRKRND